MRQHRQSRRPERKLKFMNKNLIQAGAKSKRAASVKQVPNHAASRAKEGARCLPCSLEEVKFLSFLFKKENAVSVAIGAMSLFADILGQKEERENRRNGGRVHAGIITASSHFQSDLHSTLLYAFASRERGQWKAEKDKLVSDLSDKLDRAVSFILLLGEAIDGINAEGSLDVPRRFIALAHSLADVIESY